MSLRAVPVLGMQVLIPWLRERQLGHSFPHLTSSHQLCIRGWCCDFLFLVQMFCYWETESPLVLGIKEIEVSDSVLPMFISWHFPEGELFLINWINYSPSMKHKKPSTCLFSTHLHGDRGAGLGAAIASQKGTGGGGRFAPGGVEQGMGSECGWQERERRSLGFFSAVVMATTESMLAQSWAFCLTGVSHS